MKWSKKGIIFNPADHHLIHGCNIFAQSPQTLVFDNFVRIYFSTRKLDADGKNYLSYISYADFDEHFKVIGVANHEPIGLGALGEFDEHGIFPINIFQHEDKVWAYTCGWSRRVSVPVETSTGLAMSFDNGQTFQKYSPGPVLTSSLKEPFLVGDSFVRFYDDRFHMWYIYGKKWIEATDVEPVARVYKIAHAVSEDGINWVKEEGVQIIPDILDEDECQALPTVIKIDTRYHMFFCYRYATNFRKDITRGYRLGYAWSDDGKKWVRDDQRSGIDLSSEGWDSEMMCYPHLFQFNGKYYLLYNGNEFGKHGFGVAELDNLI